jgi:hypothetical protein
MLAPFRVAPYYSYFKHSEPINKQGSNTQKNEQTNKQTNKRGPKVSVEACGQEAMETKTDVLEEFKLQVKPATKVSEIHEEVRKRFKWETPTNLERHVVNPDSVPSDSIPCAP